MLCAALDWQYAEFSSTTLNIYKPMEINIERSPQH